MPQLEPSVHELVRKFVNAFTFIDPDAGFGDRSAWIAIVNDLPPAQAQQLPQAFSAAIPAILGMCGEDRALLAIRLAVNLDVVETFGALLYLTRSYGMVDAALAAAALSGNPSVDSALKVELGALAEQLEMSERQLAVFRVLVDPNAPAETAGSAATKAERWPGLPGIAPEHRVPVVAVEVTPATPAASQWLLSGELHMAGALVRRVWNDRPAHREWLPEAVVSVGWEAGSIMAESPGGYIRAAADLFNRRELTMTLRSINESLLMHQGVELDLNPVQRSLHDPIPMGSPGQTSFNLWWAAHLEQVGSTAFRAVTDELKKLPARESLSYQRLLDLGTSVAKDVKGQGQTLHTTMSSDQRIDSLERAISEAIAAAIGRLVSDGVVRWEGNTLLLRVA